MGPYVRETVLRHADIVNRFTVQIFGVDDRGNPRPIGSGILASFEGRYFLFTATHCIADGAFFFNNPREATSSSIALADFNIDGTEYPVLSKPQTRPGTESDDVDLTVIELDKSVREHIENYHLITKQELLISHPIDHQKTYLIYGFLATSRKTQVNPSARTIKRKNRFYWLGPLSGKDYHLEMRYNWKRQSRIQPIGVSGGGLWLRPKAIYFPDEEIPARIVGLAIEHFHDRKVIRCVRIDLLTEYLRVRKNLSLPPSKMRVRMD